MAFSMHSHSGQFCPGHAQDQLEDIIKHAISIGYTTIGLTEHMPRTGLEDLYPEEVGTISLLLPETDLLVYRMHDS
jgi:histidinol-phosphatase (PHP family)